MEKTALFKPIPSNLDTVLLTLPVKSYPIRILTHQSTLISSSLYLPACLDVP